MNTRKIALIVALVALCVASNYAMISIYNVKFMDLIVFVAGFAFGPFVGATVGVSSWVIYGAVNPLGFSLPIWIATMCSEMLFGVAGALVGKALSPSEAAVSRSGVFSISLLLGIIGMLLTLVYDVATNVVWGYVYGPSMLTAVLIGFVPMGLVHMISNAFFFGTCGLPAASAITKVYGRKKIG